MPSDVKFTIREADEINTPSVTYILSDTGKRDSDNAQRIDIATTPKPNTTFFTSILNVFLPVGYPHSVTKDYIEYQIYDSLQAFSSSIAGLLSSRAVLEGVGVGDASASPTAALLLNILQESMGRIATILFAHRLGTSLEPECKMYRLAADVLNDSSMIFDCLSPALPKGPRVMLLSLSSVLRALCGVAAGSSKASLSAHFARWQNLGELNAKDSSQETVISLMGMLAGSLVVSYITSPLATWIALLFLLTIHIATNYLAVRAVCMTSLNRQRANIVFSTLYDEDRIPSVEEVSQKERIFERDGVLRWKASSTSLGYARIGAPLKELLLTASTSTDHGTSIRSPGIDIPALLALFEKEEYILWFDGARRRATIVLKRDVSPTSQLKAWSHALLVARKAETQSTTTGGDKSPTTLDIFESTLKGHSQKFDGHISRLREAGWDVETASLETTPGKRVDISRMN
ncbi:hypothetical protein FQN54_009531 [Arachnomyces sp. PD_36]|nr:hypothetical protein FQN54_009531 [Arachnomyces sp. PD_36]